MDTDLKPGDHVICEYRMPPSHQPWHHPVWVGVIEEPGDDPADWNGYNSERDYCLLTGAMRVRYPFGVMHDRKLHRTAATESFPASQMAV